MIWPPIKAWTSNKYIKGQRHFVAINYGGKVPERWVVLISVLDSDLVIRIPWSQLVETSNWECGWDENYYLDPSELLNSKRKERMKKFSHPSDDAGLIIPITKNFIRPWF